MTNYDIIIRPIITERSMAATAEKKYVFEVAPTAGKIEIKNAIEEIFGVKVAKVNTINYDGKMKGLCHQSPPTHLIREDNICPELSRALLPKGPGFTCNSPHPHTFSVSHSASIL